MVDGTRELATHEGRPKDCQGATVGKHEWGGRGQVGAAGTARAHRGTQPTGHGLGGDQSFQALLPEGSRRTVPMFMVIGLSCGIPPSCLTFYRACNLLSSHIRILRDSWNQKRRVQILNEETKLICCWVLLSFTTKRRY